MEVVLPPEANFLTHTSRGSPGLCIYFKEEEYG